MCRALFTLLAALALTCAPARADSDTSKWTPEDSSIERDGDDLMTHDQFQAAEGLYRIVLDRHPDSASALLFHVKGLNALHRYDEALRESQRAVDLEPANARAAQFLGMTLVHLHRNDEAISALRTSLMLEPDDQTSLIWLGGADLQAGQKAQADLIFDTQVHAGDGPTQAATAMQIGDFFHETGNGPMAVKWWTRSYDLGNIDAARFLAWAYSNGAPGFTYDDGTGTYWSRRSPSDPYPWFPRLACADGIVAWGHGWGVVLILLAAVVILPWITIGLVAFFPARSLINEPTFPWMERARRAYPFVVMLSICVVLLPCIDLAAVVSYPPFVLPIPRTLLMWIVFAAGFWASNVVVVRWSRLYRENAGTAWESAKDLGVILLVYLPTIAIFGAMGIYLPDEPNATAALMIAAAIAGYLLLQFGGWIRLARLVRLLVPAAPELVADTAELAQHWKIPAPAVWIIRWRKANAFAFAFSNAIVVTEKLPTILNRAEIRAILAHELAHLCEDTGTRAMRLGTPLLLLPLFTLNLWSSAYVLYALGGGYLFFVVGVFAMRRRARRMEERADSFGKAAESEAGLYPLALAKLYEANLMPAVMPGKRKVHPHLYDRLVAAGVTPDFPRPKPPGRWGGIAGLVVVALNAVVLAAIWLALF